METLTSANVVYLSPTFANLNENLVPELFHKFIAIRVYGRQCTSDVVWSKLFLVPGLNHTYCSQASFRKACS